MPQADEHLPLLDGARALAAVSVVGVHVAFATGAMFDSRFGDQLARLDVGVAVFFVLSGFLLYRPFIGARLDGRPPPDAFRFLRRRFVRIFPAYWLALTAVLVVLRPPIDLEAAFLWYSLLHVWDRDHVLGPLGQSWTLCTEVAFYVFLPIWAAAVRRVRPVADAAAVIRVELVALAGLWVLGWTWRAWAADRPEPFDGIYGSWLFGWFDHFAIGMAMAVVLADRGRRQAPAPLGLDRRWAPAICWALAVVAFWAVSEPLGVPIGLGERFGYGRTLALHALYCAVAVAVLLPAVFGPARDGRGIGRLLSNPVLTPLGVVSYGVYLWHQLALDRVRVWRGLDELEFGPAPWPTMGVVLALTVPVAAASWFLLERPLLSRAAK